MDTNAQANCDSQSTKIQELIDEIAQLKAENEKLRNEVNLYDAILDNMPVYLFAKNIDDDLRYIYWNEAFAKTSQIPRDKVLGKTDFDFFPCYEDAAKFRKDDLELIKSGKNISRHETYEAADGSTRIVQTIKHICKPEGMPRILIGISFDITALGTIDKQLVEERVKAESSDRLKSAFLANMSHEIRTPLNAIVGFSTLMVENDDKAVQALYSDIIKQNSDILLQLINDILDISKIEAGTLEYVPDIMDLHELFYHIYESNKSRTHENVTLVYDNISFHQKLILHEDQNRIMQVVVNLINNAIKFTSDGSICFGFELKGDWIEVYVRDTGTGIASDKLDKVFERFVKLDNFAQGTGLGLAISKLIVKLMGGNIWVNSELGKGSEFRFTIPFKNDRKHNPWLEKGIVIPQVTKAPLEENIDKPVILIAEDTYSNYLLLEIMLKKQYRLLWAHDGDEAIKMFKKEKPDIILMDMKMPKIDGLEATRLIRTYSETVPIIFVSANAFESDRERAKEAGGTDFLTKPVLKEVLLASIEKAQKGI